MLLDFVQTKIAETSRLIFVLVIVLGFAASCVRVSCVVVGSSPCPSSVRRRFGSPFPFRDAVLPASAGFALCAGHRQKPSMFKNTARSFAVPVGFKMPTILKS